ncbi:putative F-box protein At1g65770 [Telopea speciosissima]|uniref:putative F-box protein At1g65770 n=1 Tax=Telopea speciosissima TaxID=54955 RepID=UPI001CC3CD87|nr:putative F-box protein At1g65770 [Telopea speciosissima]
MTVAQKWSELPRELLEKIVKCLTLYADYIRVRAVCVSWQSALPKTPKHLPNQFPLLMLPYNPETDTHCKFYSLSENKSYHLDIPFEIHSKFLCGSCHGWLVTVDNTSSLALFNPFTNAHIDLPSLSEYGSQGLLSLHKVVLSSNPSSSDFMAIAIFRYCSSLLFYKCGDKRWTIVEEPAAEIKFLFRDVIFYKNQIVAVRTDGEVVIMDIIGNHRNSTPEIKIKQILRPPDSITLDHNLYLVESEDEFLIVTQLVGLWRLDDNSANHYITTGFAVYKLNWSKNSTGVINAEWSEVKSLGDWIFFLGLGPSSYFSTNDFPGCRGNCSYFSDDLWNTHLESAGGGNIALFDMENKRIKSLPCNPQGLNWPSPPAIWVTPSPI